MRRFALLLLVVVLLVPALALAEGVTLTTYTNPNNGYSIGYPEGWTLLNKDTIGDIMAQAMDGKIPGMDVSAIQGLEEQIKMLDMMACMSVDGAININVTYVDLGMELTNNQIIQMVMPAAQQQLTQALGGLEIVDAGTEEEIGDHAFVTASYTYTLGGAEMMMAQLLLCEGTTMYTITYTFNTSAINDFEQVQDMVYAVAESFTTP